MSVAPGPATVALFVNIGQKSLKASPVWPSWLLVSMHLNVWSSVFTLSKLAKLSLIWFSQCFFTDYPDYPEFCVSHSREKSKEGAMAVFLLSASDVQVAHSQSCATLLPAFARAASPWSVVPGFHPDSLIFCSSEAWSTHTGWFPYHFSVAIMNPHEVLVFCSPKASDYGTECWED